MDFRGSSFLSRSPRYPCWLQEGSSTWPQDCSRACQDFPKARDWGRGIYPIIYKPYLAMLMFIYRVMPSRKSFMPTVIWSAQPRPTRVFVRSLSMLPAVLYCRRSPRSQSALSCRFGVVSFFLDWQKRYFRVSWWCFKSMVWHVLFFPLRFLKKKKTLPGCWKICWGNVLWTGD